MIVRADMSSRAIDTAGAIVVGQMTRSWTIPGRADAPPTQMIGYDPLVLFDWAAVTSDGSIAMVRGLDYHIDWVNPDGSRGSTPRMAHDWGTRLSDSAKQAIIDSVHQLRDSIIAENLRRDSLSRANGRKPAPGTVVRVPPKYVFVYVGPSELPDYQPPFLPGEVYADADNELWIREGTNPTLDPPPIYDIVSRQGVVIDRVQAPPGLTLAGFGHDAVYFTSNEPYGTAVLTYRIR
jgi:hypothetical protein